MEQILSNEEMVIINRTIAQIYDSTNLHSFRVNFLTELKTLINFSFSDFTLGMITCDGIPKLMDPVIISKYDKNFEERFINEYENKYYKMDYVNWVFQSVNSIVYRESDLLSDSIRKQSPFYQDYLFSYDLTNIAGISIVKDGEFLGAVSLYKTSVAGDFTDKDLHIMQLLTPHLEQRLYSDMRKRTQKNKSDSHLLKYNYRITSREVEIMGYLLYGYSYAEIGDKLELSTNTIRKHVSNIFSKLNIHSRPQLISFLLVNNLTYIWESSAYAPLDES